MPGLTSTTLSPLDSTLIVTSPAPASLFLRKLLTLFSRYVPNLVGGIPEYVKSEKKKQIQM